MKRIKMTAKELGQLAYGFFKGKHIGGLWEKGSWIANKKEFVLRIGLFLWKQGGSIGNDRGFGLDFHHCGSFYIFVIYLWGPNPFIWKRAKWYDGKEGEFLWK